MKRHYLSSILTLGFSLFTAIDTNAQLHILAQDLTPQDVNNSGVIVGTIGTETSYRWSIEDGLVEIGSITKGTYIGKPLVGEDGNKIFVYLTNPESNLNEVGIYDYTTKKTEFIGGLEASSDFSSSSPWGISEDGTAVVGLGWLNAKTGQAIKWTREDGVQNIATSSINSSRANGISDDKTVIVGWQDDDNGRRHGALWKNNTQIILKDQNGNPLNEASAISGNGKYVVGFSGNYPYIWNEETGVKFIEHPKAGQFFRGGASGITYDGSTVVGYFRGWPGPAALGEGFIWNEKDGRKNLNEYVESLGIDTNGYTFALPTSISPDGTKITGIARDKNSRLFGFMLDLSNYLNTNDLLQNSEIKIFPNPVENVLNINGINSNTKVNIINTLGQHIKSAEVKDGKINVSNLSKGVYFISVTENGKTTTHKFIKK